MPSSHRKTPATSCTCAFCCSDPDRPSTTTSPLDTLAAAANPLDTLATAAASTTTTTDASPLPPKPPKKRLAARGPKATHRAAQAVPSSHLPTDLASEGRAFVAERVPLPLPRPEERVRGVALPEVGWPARHLGDADEVLQLYLQGLLYEDEGEEEEAVGCETGSSGLEVLRGGEPGYRVRHVAQKGTGKGRGRGRLAFEVPRGLDEAVFAPLPAEAPGSEVWESLSDFSGEGYDFVGEDDVFSVSESWAELSVGGDVN